MTRLEKLQEAFSKLNDLLESFKNSPASDLPKDLKFYKTVYGNVVTPSINNTMVKIHELEEQLNSSFLPKRYPSGNVKDSLLDPSKPFMKEVEVVSSSAVASGKPRNKFLELQRNSSGNKNVIKPRTNRTFARNEHPFAEVITNLSLPLEEMYAEPFDEPKFLERTLENVPLHWVDTPESLEKMYEKLKDEPIIAVDLEHHSFHSYTGLVSLIQISSSSEDFLVDPIRLREDLQSSELSLSRVLTDAKILKLFHGAESDIAWLQRDFDTFIVNMFDSYHAARILNLPRMSLAYLLEQFCGVELDKTYQLADWRERPIPEEMVEYARKDTHYLVHLYHLLKGKLSQDQYAQVLERSNRQCLDLYKAEVITEKSWKVALDRSTYPLKGDQITMVRRLFYWREWKAKELDVSPPALMPNSYLAKIAHGRVSSVQELSNCLFNVSDLLRKEFPALVEFICNITESKESEVTGISISEPEITVEQQQQLLLQQQQELQSTHIRFDETEKCTSRPVRGKVSFASKSTESSSNIFTTSTGSNSTESKILLAGLVRENIPKIEPETFKTREKLVAEQEEAEKAAKAAEMIEKVENKPVAHVHGRNHRIVEDLEIASGGSDSTVLAEKLRKNISNNKKNRHEIRPETPIESVDYTKKVKIEESEPIANEIFDPYNTISPNSEKAAFIEAVIAPATGPRLSATRLSGNRMASFTEKRK